MGSIERLRSYLAGVARQVHSHFDLASWQMHLDTGFSADACYFTLVVLTLLLLALLVLAAILLASLVLCELDSVPMSFEKALAPGRALMTFWAGQWNHVKDNYHRFHYAIEGTTRSGKSLLLTLYVRSILPLVTPHCDQRIVLFDPKNDLHPALFADAKVPVHFLLPSDERSSRWDLSRDVTCPGAVVQFCNAVVPDVPGDSGPFFTKAIRSLLGAVISSLNVTHPGAWDLADVVRILESRAYMEQVIGRTYGTQSKLYYMTEPRTWANIQATLETVLDSLRVMAAMWSRTGQRSFSLTDFVKGESILVLGRDPKYAALLDPINTLILTQLFGLLLSQSDSQTRRTYLVIDELTVAGGEDKPLPGLKDVCERGAARGVVVVVAYQSYADVKALYKESGDAVLGMLQNRIFLRTGDTPTAEFASKAFGKSRKWIKITSDGTTWGEHSSRSHTDHDHYHEEDVVPYEKFFELRPASPEDGITGYWLSPPPRRSSTPFHLPGDWIAQNLPKRSEDVEPYLQRPDHHQHLEPFSFRDLQRLRLTPPEEEDETKAALPKAALSPRPGRRPAAFPAPACAEDDITGKLRRLIGNAQSFDKDEDEHDT